MNEKVLERSLSRKIKQYGGLAIKIWSVSFTGLPDSLILLPGGRIYFAEIKTTGKKPGARQKAVHKILRELGFTVAVIDCKESLQEFLGGVV